MLNLIVILSYNSIIRGSAGFYISILDMFLIHCGSTVCCDYLRFVVFLIFLYCGISLFFRCILGLYVMLILLDYVFVVDFVCVHISPLVVLVLSLCCGSI
jgi:hypothetical protein